MAYINNNTGKIGTLYEVLPNTKETSYPTDLTRLTEEELLALGIEKHIAPPLPEPTLEELKGQKLQEIKSTFYEITNEGFKTSFGIKLDVRESDKVNWLTVRNTAVENIEGTQNIKDFNNVLHSALPNEQCKQMMDEIRHYLEKLYAEKWTLQQMIDATETKEELETIYYRKAIYSDEDQMIFSHYEYHSSLNRGE